MVVVRIDGGTVVGRVVVAVRFGSHIVSVGCRCISMCVVASRSNDGGIPIVVVVAVGVVHRIHRARASCVVLMVVRLGRVESVVIVAEGSRTVVVGRACRHRNYHPALVARTIPAEGDGLEVFKGSEAVKIVAHFIVGHDSKGTSSLNVISRYGDGHSLDSASLDLDVFFGIAVAVVRVEVEADVASVGIVTDVFHIVIDCDGIVVINHHGL